MSVLYVPAWQPLLSYALSPEKRQLVNSRGRAGAGAVLGATVVVFGLASQAVRVLLLAVIGVVAASLLLSVRRLSTPRRPSTEAVAETVHSQRSHATVSGLTSIYVTTAVVAVGTWPLFLVYTHEILWPSVNLGVVGATQLGGSLLAAALWSPTVTRLVHRARLSSAALVGAAAVLALIRGPVDGGIEGAAVLAATGMAAAATTTIFLALIELVHNRVDEHSSVKALTIFDVVASTSMQLGLLAAGFVIAAAGRTSTWPIDPYRIFLLVNAIIVLLLATRLSSGRTRS